MPISDPDLRRGSGDIFVLDKETLRYSRLSDHTHKSGKHLTRYRASVIRGMEDLPRQPTTLGQSGTCVNEEISQLGSEAQLKKQKVGIA